MEKTVSAVGNAERLTERTKGEEPIDPRRRVWIPIEKKNLDGSTVFSTSDGQKYRREVNGTIRKATR